MAEFSEFVSLADTATPFRNALTKRDQIDDFVAPSKGSGGNSEIGRCVNLHGHGGLREAGLSMPLQRCPVLVR